MAGFKSAFSLGLSTENPGIDIATFERSLIWEALLRGADDIVLFKLLFQWRQFHFKQGPFSEKREQFGFQGLRLLPSDGLQTAPLHLGLEDLIYSETKAYREFVRREFESLPSIVQVAFGMRREGEDKRAVHERRLRGYLEMRSKYYAAGYIEPAEIFKDITEGSFLGISIRGGIHRRFLEKLNQVEGILNGWTPGLAGQVRAEIRGIGGFVPRFIAPKQGAKKRGPVLSYHAFGLAIDIDPRWNPHIKDREVMEVLNWVVRDMPGGFDFGKRIAEDLKGIPHPDRVRQIHLRASQASDIVKGWLQRYLPDYKAIMAKLEEDKKLVEKTKSDLKKIRPGSQAYAEAKKASEEAVDKLARDERELSANENLKAIHALSKYHKGEIEEWSKKGILSLPLNLVAAMAALGDVRWGEEYEKSKDAMHFELLVNLVDDRRPRPVEDLYPHTALSSPETVKHIKRRAKQVEERNRR